MHKALELCRLLQREWEGNWGKQAHCFAKLINQVFRNKRVKKEELSKIFRDCILLLSSAGLFLLATAFQTNLVPSVCLSFPLNTPHCPRTRSQKVIHFSELVTQRLFPWRILAWALKTDPGRTRNKSFIIIISSYFFLLSFLIIISTILLRSLVVKPRVSVRVPGVGAGQAAGWQREFINVLQQAIPTSESMPLLRWKPA